MTSDVRSTRAGITSTAASTKLATATATSFSRTTIDRSRRSTTTVTTASSTEPIVYLDVNASALAAPPSATQVARSRRRVAASTRAAQYNASVAKKAAGVSTMTIAP